MRDGWCPGGDMGTWLPAVHTQRANTHRDTHTTHNVRRCRTNMTARMQARRQVRAHVRTRAHTHTYTYERQTREHGGREVKACTRACERASASVRARDEEHKGE
eukprot:Tamp_20926.p4 GENE.Tamp_20926~~Tamp_20926.p4  ORF type:complete len:104 (-),score=7.81 Tamp_20926:255-566(-)